MAEDITRAEKLERMERALARMPERRRAIFLAVRLGGASYAEIAERTGLTIRKVEREVAAALVQLDRAVHHHRREPCGRRRFRSFLGDGYR